MKAKIDMSHIYIIETKNSYYWEYKRKKQTVYPETFYNIWKRNKTINIIPALLNTFGDYKFLNADDNKIYWIKKELIKPIFEIEDKLFEI